MSNVNQPFYCTAIGQEVIHNQNVFSFGQELLRCYDMVYLIVGIGLHFGSIQILIHIAACGLLCK